MFSQVPFITEVAAWIEPSESSVLDQVVIYFIVNKLIYQRPWKVYEWGFVLFRR